MKYFVHKKLSNRILILHFYMTLQGYGTSTLIILFEPIHMSDSTAQQIVLLTLTCERKNNYH